MSTMNAPEDDIQASQAPQVAKLGGGITLGAGALAVLVAAQTLTGFWVSTRFLIGVVLLGALGVAEGAFGLALMRARAWAPVAATAGSAVLFLAGSLWLLASVGTGLLSLFALGTPPMALGATVLGALTIGPVRRVAEARARLQAQGLDMGT
jgi:hypothetical protein